MTKELVQHKFIEGEYQFTYPHFFEAMADDSLTFSDFHQIIQNGKIGDFQDDKGDQRSVLKHSINGTLKDKRRFTLVFRKSGSNKLLFITAHETDKKSEERNKFGYREIGRSEEAISEYGICEVCWESFKEINIECKINSIFISLQIKAGICACGKDDMVVNVETGKQLLEFMKDKIYNSI